MDFCPSVEDKKNFVKFTFFILELLDHKLDFAHGPVHDGVELRRAGQVIDLKGSGFHVSLAFFGLQDPAGKSGNGGRVQPRGAHGGQGYPSVERRPVVTL